MFWESCLPHPFLSNHAGSLALLKPDPLFLSWDQPALPGFNLCSLLLSPPAPPPPPSHETHIARILHSVRLYVRRSDSAYVRRMARGHSTWDSNQQPPFCCAAVRGSLLLLPPAPPLLWPSGMRGPTPLCERQAQQLVKRVCQQSYYNPPHRGGGIRARDLGIGAQRYPTPQPL